MANHQTRMLSKLTGILLLAMLINPMVSMGQEINEEGWPIPDLGGVIPYTISVKLSMEWKRSLRKFIPPMGGMWRG